MACYKTCELFGHDKMLLSGKLSNSKIQTKQSIIKENVRAETTGRGSMSHRKGSEALGRREPPAGRV